MKKILFSHSLFAKNKSALNGSKLTLALCLLYMSTEVANRAERVNSLRTLYVSQQSMQSIYRSTMSV